MTAVAPWSQEPHIAQSSLVTSLETLRICGICLQPFVPLVSGKLLDALGIPVHERTWDFAVLSPAINGKGKIGAITRGVRLFDSPSSRRRSPISKKSTG
jgi:methionyl-tRNA synthetase